MRFILFSLFLLTVACRRPSTQFAAMLTPINEPANYSLYLKAGDELMAMSSEPAWSLTINPLTGMIRFKSANGDSITLPVPARQIEPDGVFRYKAPLEAGSLNVLFRPDSCVDKLSGQGYDYHVEVDVRGKNYVGCGVSLQQLALLQDSWVLTDFQGQPVTATQTGTELPRVELSLTENRVTGTTGCNRLTGNLKADTRQILLGPLATTRMACAGDAGQFEIKFLNELKTALAYQVSDRKLMLLRNGKPVMTFKKVD